MDGSIDVFLAGLLVGLCLGIGVSVWCIWTRDRTTTEERENQQ